MDIDSAHSQPPAQIPLASTPDSGGTADSRRFTSSLNRPGSRPLILALNPSVDAEWLVPSIRLVEKNQIQSERRWAGGKGINVARWLQYLGGRARLLIPLGGSHGREVARSLKVMAVPFRSIPIAQSTRVNVIVTPDAGAQLRLNAPAPVLTPQEWNSILEQIIRWLSSTSVLVLSGSLPGGLPKNAYGKLIRLARKHGVPTLLDCDGDALAQAIHARPWLVKPNVSELEGWAGKRLQSQRAILMSAFALSRVTHGYVMVSCGSDGAVLVHASGNQWIGRIPRVTAVNTVGAGDAMVAGIISGLQPTATPDSSSSPKRVPTSDPVRWMLSGLAVSLAMVQQPAGVMASRRTLALAAARIGICRPSKPVL